MALPAYDSSGTGSHQNSQATALTPTMPATLSAGDGCLLVIVNRSTTSGQTYTITGVTGWNLEATIEGGSATQPHVYIYSLISDGTEDGATVTCTCSGGTVEHKAIIHRFTGVKSSSWFTYLSNVRTTGTTTIPDTGTTTVSADQLAVNIIADNGSHASCGDFTGETGGNWIERNWYQTGTNPAIGLQTADMASAGTVDGGTVTLASNPACRVVAAYISPAAAAAGQPAVKRMGGVPFASPNRGVW